jgi:hypothetical protein
MFKNELELLLPVTYQIGGDVGRLGECGGGAADSGGGGASAGAAVRAVSLDDVDLGGAAAASPPPAKPSMKDFFSSFDKRADAAKKSASTFEDTTKHTLSSPVYRQAGVISPQIKPLTRAGREGREASGLSLIGDLLLGPDMSDYIKWPWQRSKAWPTYENVLDGRNEEMGGLDRSKDKGMSAEWDALCEALAGIAKAKRTKAAQQDQETKEARASPTYNLAYNGGVENALDKDVGLFEL